MRWRLAYWLHRLSGWISPEYWETPSPTELPIQYVIELPHGTPERSDPVDAHALWREQVYDGQFYNEDMDVYRPGTYL